MVNAGDLQALLPNGESTWLDWKAEFNSPLLIGSSHPKWDEERGELVKDITSLANGRDGRQIAYLIVGVVDHHTHRTVRGTQASFDDALFQDWMRFHVGPRVTFEYHSIQCDDAVAGAFRIVRDGRAPHVIVQDLGGMIHRGQVWFRIGTSCRVALQDDLREMFRPLEPVGFTNPNDPAKAAVEQHYRRGGRELAWISYGDKQARLLDGWELAYHPSEVGREVHITYPGSEAVLMLRPK